MSHEDKNLRRKEFMRADPGLQPDPALQLSGGRSTSTMVWLVALTAVIIVALVLFGLTWRTSPVEPAMEQSAQSAPPREATPRPADRGTTGREGQEPPRVAPGPPADPRGGTVR